MLNKYTLLFTIIMVSIQMGYAQENDISGIEVSWDQDRYADAFRQLGNDDSHEDANYTTGLRIGIYGAYANHVYLGLPFVRQKLDGFLVDRLLENGRFRESSESHNFVFTVNGFSPSVISDTTQYYIDLVDDGYNLADDRPFSSFTGFRSSRRLEGNKLFAHSAYQIDLAINTSFTFGFMSLGLAQGVENLFGGNRPSAILWDRDPNEDHPTGQLAPRFLPLFMYSISAEAVVWQPIRKVLLQVRPEINLGYYTNVGLGIDFGKVMNVEQNIDNLGYTDTNNPSLLAVNNDNISFSLVGGVTIRAVLFNAHLYGFYRDEKNDYNNLGSKVLLLESYVGAKLQLFKKVEFTFSVNRRSQEFNSPINAKALWGTIGMKYLIAPEGEGCYD